MMTKEKPPNIDDFTREYIRTLDTRVDNINKALDRLIEEAGQINTPRPARLLSSRYVENEIAVLRRRIKALQDQGFLPPDR